MLVVPEGGPSNSGPHCASRHGLGDAARNLPDAFTIRRRPEAHAAGSSYHRPGDEWGTGFRFDASGCWHIHLARNDTTGDVWLDVGR